MFGPKRRIPLAMAAAVAAALAGLPAHAQQTVTETASSDDCKVNPSNPNCQLEEVVVTGSLIRRAASETTEAVTVLKADVLVAEGVQTVEQALNMLTSNNPSINIAAAVGTFSGGGTYADLRGLGNGRTLVLLDGQRLANNANSGNAVDLSGIPFSAIDRIEVLREGASAEYGSDAIAGVINFITKQNYQGADLSGTFDRPQTNGGNSGQLNFSLGHGDLKSDGYNFMITASYSNQDELRATQRSFSATGFYPGLGYTSTNDPGTWPAQFLDGNGNLWQSGYPACSGNPFLTEYFGNCAYKYSAATDLVPQSEEYSGLVSFTKSLPGDNQLQLQYFWTRSEVTGWSGPMFYFFQLDPTSPYYPTAGQLTCSGGAANCSAPPDLTDPSYAIWSDPLNNRYSGNINLEQRLLLTFSGKAAGFDYSASANYSQNNNNNRNVGGYPNEAVLAPGGILSTLINPFGPQSAQGQALINGSYINGTYSLGEDKRWSLDGNISHGFGHMFNAPNPVTLAIGVDVGGERFEEGTTPYNDLVQAATGLSSSAVAGSRQTQAAFAELDLPFTKQIDLDISDREDRYSDFGSTNNGKLALQYSPFSALKFRGTASTGFRAPTLYDLYSPNFIAASSSGTMGQGNPFCTPATYNAEWNASDCNTQGLGVYGGNAHLTPEKSKNYDLGVVISPPIQGLDITVDYYRIVVTNTIGSVPESAIYGNPAAFGNLIHPSTLAQNGQLVGTLTPSILSAGNCTPYYAPSCGYITLGDTNTGQDATNGIDVSVTYSHRTDVGLFSVDLEGNMVTLFETQQYTGGPELNLVGDFNELPPAFRWQHNLRFDWASPEGMWGAELSNRYYSSYIDEYPDGAGNQRMVGSYSLWNGDVTVKPVERLTLLFGIKNILNTSPPFTNAFEENFAAGYNPLTADPLLRNFYVNVAYKLW
jgi:iron complex outermembrane recepter protein